MLVAVSFPHDESYWLILWMVRACLEKGGISMRKLFFHFVTLCMSCVAPLYVACATELPSLSGLFLSFGVNADGSPQERVTAYSPGAPRMAAFAECRNTAVGTTVHFSWYIVPPGRGRILFAEYAAKSPVRRKTTLFHSTVSLGKEWPEGDYVVEARLEGETSVKSVAFSVKKTVPPPENRSGGEAKTPAGGRRRGDAGAFRSAKDSALEQEERADRERRLAEKEAVFRKNPSDFSAVLELADAYAAMDDAASASLALALYKGLAESSPSDMMLARLADAYARLFRYDRAFTTALRRTWNPLVSPEGAVSQILLFSLASGDLDRGIDCLLHILRERADERESVLPALAALYIEKSGTARDRSLREEYRSAAAASLDEAEGSLPGGSGMSESVLLLRKELEER